MSLIIKESLSNINIVAQQVITTLSNNSIITFEGNLGSGKTTLIKEICKLKDCNDSITSPTYSIINEYKTTAGNNIYHMDLYRLNTTEEAEEIGFLDFMDSGNLCLIEWPAIALPLIDLPHLAITIQNENDGERIYHLEMK